MEKLHFSININAPKEKVWDTMLGNESFKKWTEPFAPGSHYKGDWNKGSKIVFLAPDKSGQMGGMVSRIAENNPYQFVSIEHLGEIKNGIEDNESDIVRSWAGAHENYTLQEHDGRTKVLVDVDIIEDFREMFLETWPKALQKLKELSEDYA